jgi:hypothetical protein
MTGCGYGKNKPVEGLHQRINGGYLCCRCGVGAGSRVADAGRGRPVSGGSEEVEGGNRWRGCTVRVPAGKQAGREPEAGARIRVVGGQQAAAARRWRAGADGRAARYTSACREAGRAGVGSRGVDTGGGRPTSSGSEEVEDGNVRCRCNAVRARKQMGRVREAGRGSGQRSSGRQPERGSQRAVGARRWQRGDEMAALGCQRGGCGPGSRRGGYGKEWGEKKRGA